jgi:prepilin-type N-terminal cleavage/methylation domain-containing protein
MSRRRGFSLLELLLAVSLMALAGMAATAALGGGIRVWQRAQAFGTGPQAAAVAWSRLERDLHNVRRFGPLPFDGSGRRLTFASVQRASDEPDAAAELGRLGYYHDEAQGLLCRTFVPYRLLSREGARARCHPILEDVARVRFSYLDGDSGGWVGGWEEDRPPRAVKLEVTVGRRAGAGTPQTFLGLLDVAAPAWAHAS